MVCYPALRGRGLANNHIRLISICKWKWLAITVPLKATAANKKVTGVETIMLTTGEKLMCGSPAVILKSKQWKADNIQYTSEKLTYCDSNRNNYTVINCPYSRDWDNGYFLAQMTVSCICHASLDHFLLAFHLCWLQNGLWCLPELIFRSLWLSAAAATTAAGLIASKCSTSSQWSQAADSPYLISSSISCWTGGVHAVPSWSLQLSNNTFSLGEWSLRAQFRLWMVTPCLRLMLARWANSQGFCSGMFSRLC